MALVFSLMAAANSAIYSGGGASEWRWLQIYFHTTLCLKSLAWIVAVRSYQRRYTIHQLLEYLFHPCFMFFTNDLAVLTPERFFRSSKSRSRVSARAAVGSLIAGIGLLTVYAGLQNYYFQQTLGRPWSLPAVGGLLSVVTAIIFHWGNVSLQAALLQAEGRSIAVDMNRPWVATNPSDYWRRMHYYVREYIFEVLVRPLVTTFVRRGLSGSLLLACLLLILFFGFTFTQIGYQPYRADRSGAVGLMVTGLFFCITVLPEMVPSSVRALVFGRANWRSRIFLWSALIFVYGVIYSLRRGF